GLRVSERGGQLECASTRSAARALGRGADAAMTAPLVRIVLPTPLRQLARVNGELRLGVAEPVTQRTILDAVEASYPMLRGTLRDHVTHRRRDFVRFYACEEDWSNAS